MNKWYIYIYDLKEKQSVHDLFLKIEWIITQVDWLSRGTDAWEHHSFNKYSFDKQMTMAQNFFYLLYFIREKFISIYKDR